MSNNPNQFLPNRYTYTRAAGVSSSQYNATRVTQLGLGQAGLKSSARTSSPKTLPKSPSSGRKNSLSNGVAATIQQTSLPASLPPLYKTPKIDPIIMDQHTHYNAPLHGRRSSTPDKTTTSTTTTVGSNSDYGMPFDRSRTTLLLTREQPNSTSNSNHNNSIRPPSPRSLRKKIELTQTTDTSTIDKKPYLNLDTTAVSLPPLGSPSKRHDVNATLSSAITGLSLMDNSIGFTLNSHQGLVGLRNLGNTCYMNSILQCLSATKCLTSVLISNENDVLKRAKKNGVVQGYVDLLKQMWRSEKTSSAIAPSLFKQRLQRLAPQFQGYDQHDSQEFLRFLLNGLHDELNRAQPHPRRGSSLSPSPIFTEDKAVHAWRASLEYDNSEVSDIFMGQLRSILQCQQCGHNSVTFDPFWDLSLPIPRSKSKSVTSYSSSYGLDAVTLDDCFKLFTAIENLDGDNKPLCDSCKGLQPGTKRLSIQKFPKILVIHLKRFSGLHYRTKLSTSVRFEETMTLSSEEGHSVQYTLYAISNHSGSCYGGHYTAHCRHPVQERWYQFNDSSVAPVSSASIQTNQAYVLFYKKAT